VIGDLRGRRDRSESMGSQRRRIEFRCNSLIMGIGA
jgi:hypothetical protein